MKQFRIELDCQLILFYEREDSECSKAFKISLKRFKAPASILNSFLRLLSFLALRLCNLFEEEREEVEEAFKNATLSPSTCEHLRNRSSRSPRGSAARTRAPRRASERRASSCRSCPRSTGTSRRTRPSTANRPAAAGASRARDAPNGRARGPAVDDRAAARGARALCFGPVWPRAVLGEFCDVRRRVARRSAGCSRTCVTVSQGGRPGRANESAKPGANRRRWRPQATQSRRPPAKVGNLLRWSCPSYGPRSVVVEAVARRQRNLGGQGLAEDRDLSLIHI